jgi:hypothetical protein
MRGREGGHLLTTIQFAKKLSDALSVSGFLRRARRPTRTSPRSMLYSFLLGLAEVGYVDGQTGSAGVFSPTNPNVR